MIKTIIEFTLLPSIQLSQEIRWKKYLPLGIHRESVLSHSYSSSLLAITILNIFESSPPDFDYDPYKLLSCIAMHDLGETNCGDTHYQDKDGSEEECEYSSFKELISGLPCDLQEQLIDQYSIQFDHDTRNSLGIFSSEKRGNQILYEFIERIGYVIFAVNEYKQNERTLPLLLQVLRNQLTHIEQLLSEIPQMRIIVTDDFLEWAKTLLNKYKNKYLEE